MFQNSKKKLQPLKSCQIQITNSAKTNGRSTNGSGAQMGDQLTDQVHKLMLNIENITKWKGKLKKWLID